MLLPFIVGDMVQLLKNLPSYIEKMKSYLQLDFPYREQLIQKINANAVSIGNMILNKGYGLLSGSLAFFGTLIAVPIFTFYFLKDKESIVSFFWKFIPKKYEKISREFLKTIDTRMKGFFRGQFLDFSVLASILTIGFYIIGLKYAILIAILCAIFNLIPYLGMVLSIAIVGLVAWLQGGTILFIGIILGFFLIVQLVESIVLSPYLIGSSAAVHPLAIVLAIMLGGAAFGLFGILFAIPGLIVIDVLLPHFTSLIDSQKETKRGKRTIE